LSVRCLSTLMRTLKGGKTLWINAAGGPKHKVVKNGKYSGAEVEKK